MPGTIKLVSDYHNRGSINSTNHRLSMRVTQPRVIWQQQFWIWRGIPLKIFQKSIRFQNLRHEQLRIMGWITTLFPRDIALLISPIFSPVDIPRDITDTFGVKF